MIRCLAPFCLALLMIPCADPAAANGPNVLLIYTDDHGWADLGAQGVNKDIRTPNIDQLARDGVLCTRGYVSAPQCVPSRAGVITGRYQQRFGVEDNNKGPLPLAETTIAERLKPAGYISGFVGKCHLDIGGAEKIPKSLRLMPEHMPHHQGFDEYWRGELREYYASHALDGTPFPDAPRRVADSRFRVVVQTEAALSFLDRRAAKPGQPWFLYLAWYAPHVPLESPEPWFSRTPAHLPRERRQALAMIAAMDEGVGQIRAKLKAMGQDQNTLIFFIGDNGAPVKPGAWDGSLNEPLIGEKGMLTDGGIRTPFVAAWPGTLPAGAKFEHPVISLDVAATAAAIAGLPHDDRLDGVNLVPFLTGRNQDAPHDTLYWRWRSQAAVLEFPWKLIHLGDHDKYLFNVAEPGAETAANNQLAGQPEIAARLEAKLAAWCKTLQPPGPPEANHDQDNSFYAAHVAKSEPMRPKGRGTAAPATDDAATIQGWLCRNGQLSLKDGVLVITADHNASQAPFLAHSRLDLAGPVAATLRLRAESGGAARIAWRTREESFTSRQSAGFDWAAGAEWREVRVTLPENSRIIHVRIHTPQRGAGLEVQSLRFEGRDGNASEFRFDKQSSR
jgi:uncharacterized sulfatase